MNEDASHDHFDPNDPLMAAWAGQSTTDGAQLPVVDPEALATSIAKAHHKEQRRLVWANVRELTACLVLIVVYGSLVPGSVHPWMTVAAAVLVVATGSFLLASSLRHARSDRRWGSSFREQLARRLAQVKHRIWMYRNLFWWYFLPLALATTLFVFGVAGIMIETVAMALVAGVLQAVACRWAYNRALRRYEPDAERLESLLTEINRAA